MISPKTATNHLSISSILCIDAVELGVTHVHVCMSLQAGDLASHVTVDCMASSPDCHGDGDEDGDGFVEGEGEGEEMDRVREEECTRESERNEETEQKMDADSENESEESASSTATAASYLHGDGKTVQKLVARALRKKYNQQQQRSRPRKEKKVTPHNKTKKCKGRRDIKLALDSDW